MNEAVQEWLLGHPNVTSKWSRFTPASQATVLAWPIFLVIKDSLVPLMDQVGGGRGSRTRKFLLEALKEHGIGKPHLQAADMIVDAEEWLPDCDMETLKVAFDGVRIRGVENCVGAVLKKANDDRRKDG